MIDCNNLDYANTDLAVSVISGDGSEQLVDNEALCDGILENH